MNHPVLLGAEPLSHVGDGPYGALVIHGYTGNPSSMRELAEAFAAAGFHVEMPRLPGHGTHVDDMVPTRWPDYVAEAERAYQALAARADQVVVAGLSMGGALTLRIGADHPEIVGLICINAATAPIGLEDMGPVMEQLLDAGVEVAPGIGSDIADPDVRESAYEGSPLRPLTSFIEDGLAAMAARYGELTMPLLLFTSRQDHVVEPAQSEYLVEQYGGTVDHRWLERSYHVATMDFDRDVISVEAATFSKQVTGS